ncbi:MAG: sugar porter family MFS transporter [Planctomycetes bacterium]|nr:sugar porter family MFS transporter [Planctomycetota bacterium]
MNRRVLSWSIVSALAGFLFGFDTVVISGAEQKIQSLWQLDGATHGWAMSMALWGTVLGSLLGGWPTERLGRTRTLQCVGVLYFVSAVGSALATEELSFMLARFIGGLGVGISTVAAPLYISEIAPAHLRGRLAGMFQFNIVFGILIAFFSNAVLRATLDESVAWRWMLGVEAFPALLFTVLSYRLPESPRWLIVHAGKRTQGIDVFRQIHPERSEEELAEMADRVRGHSEDQAPRHRFFTSRLRVPILLAFLVAFFNQLSGINVVLYFAPRLLGLAGIEDPLGASIGIGVTNLVFTFVGLWLIDRLGRRTLLTIGSFGYIASLAVCAWAFLSHAEFRVVSKAIDVVEISQNGGELDAEERLALRELEDATHDPGYRGEVVTLPSNASTAQVHAIAESTKARASELLGATSWLVLFCILAFIAAHAVGQGAVIWVFIAEIFPNRDRASGQALGSFTHWVFAASLTLLFPIAIEHVEPGHLFLFFCVMMVVQLIWVRAMVPETKGVTLEELERTLGGRKERGSASHS